MRIILAIVLTLFAGSTLANTGTPSGVRAKKDSIPEETFRRAYQKLSGHYEKIFPRSGEKGFIIESCRVNGLKDSCGTPLEKDRVLFLPGIPMELIRTLDDARKILQENEKARLLLRTELETREIAQGETERERNALRNEIVATRSGLEATIEERNALKETVINQEQTLSSTEGRLSVAEEEQARSTFLYKGTLLSLVFVLAIVLITMITKRKKTGRYRQKRVSRTKCTWKLIGENVVEVTFPTEVSKAELSRNPDARPMYLMYGRRTIILEVAKTPRNQVGTFARIPLSTTPVNLDSSKQLLRTLAKEENIKNIILVQSRVAKAA